MIAFLCTFKPRSVNAKGTSTYKKKIVESFKQYYPDDVSLFDRDIYGISYYFYKKPTQLDADNLSKPIWDALNSVLYNDDRLIKLRYSGVYNLANTVTKLDFTRMPKKVYGDFLDSVEKRDHILYIEVGKLADEQYVFGMENDATL